MSVHVCCDLQPRSYAINRVQAGVRTDLLLSPSVGPVGQLWKTADWIWMPLGIVSLVSRGIGVLDGVEIVEREGALLWVNVGHAIVTSEDFVM